MKVFVLIILFWPGSYPAITTVEFNSEQTCEAAKAKMAKDLDSSLVWGRHPLNAVCAEK